MNNYCFFRIRRLLHIVLPEKNSKILQKPNQSNVIKLRFYALPCALAQGNNIKIEVALATVVLILFNGESPHTT